MPTQRLPLPKAFLEKVRTRHRDDQDRTVQPLVSEGGDPLRCCLRRSTPGERISLVSFSPFDQPNAFKEYGPIYVHPEACPGAPPGDGLPAEFDEKVFAFRAYSPSQEILDAVLAPGRAASDVIETFLARTDVAHVDARFGAYGCFFVRFVRA